MIEITLYPVLSQNPMCIIALFNLKLTNEWNISLAMLQNKNVLVIELNFQYYSFNVKQHVF